MNLTSKQADKIKTTLSESPFMNGLIKLCSPQDCQDVLFWTLHNIGIVTNERAYDSTLLEKDVFRFFFNIKRGVDQIEGSFISLTITKTSPGRFESIAILA